jgi:phage baseplate assembly protein gpV
MTPTETIEEQIFDDFNEAIKLSIDNALLNLHTSMPGIIDSFDPVTQIATVQPAIKRILRDGQEINLPKLINVPVMFPRAGGYSFTLPVKQGDECKITFCERALDSWVQSGGIQAPIDRRKHNLSDAYVELGLYSQPNVIENFEMGGAQLRSDSGDTYILVKESEIELKAPTVNVNAGISNFSGDVNISGKLTVTGVIESLANVIVGLITLIAHRHGGVTTGPDDTGVPKP